MSLCIFPFGSAHAQDPNDLYNPEEAVVKIVLTKFDVNDTRLELGWKITNNTNHDVWICDQVDYTNSARFEELLAIDAETLVIRSRSYIKEDEGILREFPFIRSLYIRLYPGQEKVYTYHINVPIRQGGVFTTERTNAEFAKRLVMEIGFYDEDLPGLILQIIDINNKLNCDINEVDFDDNDLDILERFFPGWQVARAYSHDAIFRNGVTSGRDRIQIPYMGKVLNGEKILRIEIDGLSIPLEEVPLLSDL